MKEYEELLPKFSNDPDLEYKDKFVDSNNNIYRGQIKKLDETNGSESQEKQEPLKIVRHGYGVQYWTDGDHYEGHWNNNEKEGQGTFWFGNGDVYKGEFRFDC